MSKKDFNRAAASYRYASRSNERGITFNGWYGLKANHFCQKTFDLIGMLNIMHDIKNHSYAHFTLDDR